MFRALHTTPLRCELGTITEVVINEIISNIKMNKSLGYEKISPEFVKECGNEIASFLTDIFNKMINTSVYPYIK